MILSMKPYSVVKFHVRNVSKTYDTFSSDQIGNYRMTGLDLDTIIENKVVPTLRYHVTYTVSNKASGTEKVIQQKYKVFPKDTMVVQIEY